MLRASDGVVWRFLMATLDAVYMSVERNGVTHALLELEFVATEACWDWLMCPRGAELRMEDWPETTVVPRNFAVVRAEHVCPEC